MSKFKVFALLMVVALMFMVVSPVGATYDHPKPIAVIDKNDCKGYKVIVDNAPEHSTWSPVYGHWEDPYVTESVSGKILVKWYTWEWKWVGPKWWQYDWVKEWHEVKLPYQVNEPAKCLREYASVDIETNCGEIVRGSWMVVKITTKHATFYLDDLVITGTQEITLPNEEAPFNWYAKADEGYKFADGTKKIKGVLEQLEKCWVNGPRRECPECGPHMDEVATVEGNLIQAEGALDCYDCFKGKYYGYITTGAYTYLRWDKPFKILVSVSEQSLIDAGVAYEVKEISKHKIMQVFIVAQEFKGLDKSYYVIMQPKSLTHDNWVVYDMDGNRLDGFGNDIVDKYIPCSLSYGPWFVQADGTMLLPKLLNINSSDVISWLVTAGYSADYETADAWIDPLWENALETGVIGPLPAK